MAKSKQLTVAIVALASVAGFSFSQIEVNHVAAATTPSKSNVASNTASTFGIDPNNPVLPDQSKTRYIDDSQVLETLKAKNPTAYNKIPQATIDSIENSGLLRQGGTYAKVTSDGITIYINSALVTVAKIAGTAAISTALASVLDVEEVGKKSAVFITSSMTGILDQFSAERGIWMHFTNYDPGSTGEGNLLLSSCGQQ